MKLYEIKSRKKGTVQIITEQCLNEMKELGIVKRFIVKESKPVELPKKIVINKKNEGRRKESSE